ncbi:hypothetical protein H5410_025228 [Solanum commersonii]|uniref:Uncharacterized protein n=1 Tax=Solanum commersonii TaxID=4109 RepID=A0A9J5YVB9_SOLCO|nr:hypothetical protein H5410_025228 [Solanum commersonii]
MNHKAFSLLLIAFFVLIFCFSSATSRRLLEEDGKVPQGSLPYRPLGNIIGKCIANKKPPRIEKPCKSLTNCHKMKP